MFALDEGGVSSSGNLLTENTRASRRRDYMNRDRFLMPTDELNVRVSSVEQLADECRRFHDFPFELDAQAFDPVRRTWTGYFLRGTSDPARVVTTRRPWLVKVTEFPVFEVRVTIRNVVEAEIQDRAQIAWHTFRQVHRTADGCRFEFHQDCDIYLDLDGPFDGEISDVRELTDTCGRITSIGFIDFGIEVGAVLPDRRDPWNMPS